MQKLARAVIGTNNIDNCSRYCQSPATAGLFRTVGYGGDSGSITDIEQADLVVIIGSNTAESHPVLATRVKQRAQAARPEADRLRPARERDGAARRSLPARQARHRPGLAVGGQPLPARQRPGATPTFLEPVGRTGSTSTGRASSRSRWSSPRAICGLPVETLEARGAHDRRGGAASAFSGRWASRSTPRAPTPPPRSRTCCSSPATTCGRGPARIRCAGTTTCRARATTARCRTCCPAISRSTIRRCGRASRRRWSVTLPTTKGLDNHQMVDAIHQGKLKAMYLFGEEMSTRRLERELRRRRRSRSSTSSSCRTSSSATPASSPTWCCRPLRAWRRKARSPAPSGASSGSTRCSSRSTGSRPDWQIIQDVANRLGAGWNYQHPSEIMDEIASLTPMFAGVTYERLEGYKIAAMAGRGRRHRPAAALHQAFRLPGRQGAAVPARRGRSRPSSPTRNSTCT